MAVSATRAGGFFDMLPGHSGAGSQENVTRVLPFSPRAVPIQKCAARSRAGETRSVSAVVTADGASGFFGAFALATSSSV